ncbi:hypothetical protein C8F01DRAFT_1090404 [Mycena amicta]|nr:hypothetical protein C8F01DRAFT_1090404 [Mycena amicta]
MTDAGAITIIVDDADFLDSSWRTMPLSQGVYPSRYNNTNVVFDLKSVSVDASFDNFDGASVQLYGIAPPPDFNQKFFIAPTPESPSYGWPVAPEYSDYHAPQYGGLQYTSPPNANLSNLVLAQAVGFALDYAVVAVYPTTELFGKTIIVDDASASSALIWRGSWTVDNNFTLPVGCSLPFNATSDPAEIQFTAHMAPHANTTHASQTVGDEFEFGFTGTSISVYGITPSDPFSGLPWLLRMSFTLDAAEPIMVNITSQEFVYEQPHVVYFNASSIPAGNHSLVGRIVDVVGSTLPRARIDYITYNPSFASQAEMPVLPPFASTPTSSSDEGSSSGDSAKAKRTSAAVGAAGAIVLCGLAIVLVVYMRRRQTRRRNRTLQQVYEPFSESSLSATGSYIPVVTQRGTVLLGNDTRKPRTVLVPQEPVNAGPLAIGNVSQPLVDARADRFPPPAPRGNTKMLDSRFRELQTRVEQLTREVRGQVLPPAYEGDAA